MIYVRKGRSRHVSAARKRNLKRLMVAKFDSLEQRSPSDALDLLISVEKAAVHYVPSERLIEWERGLRGIISEARAYARPRQLTELKEIMQTLRRRRQQPL